MKTLLKSLFVSSALTVALFAGALTLQVGDPATDPEALRSHAVLVARITACNSPEKTVVTATAEGVVNGIRKTIPLKVLSLSTAGTFAVTRQWPEQGTWAIKLVATNPVYVNYVTSVVVPIHQDSAQLAAARHYYHAPTDAEVSLALN